MVGEIKITMLTRKIVNVCLIIVFYFLCLLNLPALYDFLILSLIIRYKHLLQLNCKSCNYLYSSWQ